MNYDQLAGAGILFGLLAALLGLVAALLLMTGYWR